MILKNAILLITAFILLTGCAKPGPMQTSDGLMKTKAFKPIFIDTVKDGSSEILFKEFTTMYENKELKSFGVFTITDKGVYFAVWDVSAYEYSLLFKLQKNEISKLGEDIVVRDYWVDSELITILDKNNNEVGFALNGKRAALTTLYRLTKESNKY